MIVVSPPNKTLSPQVVGVMNFYSSYFTFHFKINYSLFTYVGSRLGPRCFDDESSHQCPLGLGLGRDLALANQEG